MPEPSEKTVAAFTDMDATVLPMRQPLPPVFGGAVSLPIGTRLGEFEITGLVGEGGFGIVYLAQDHSLGRVVAVKEYMPTSLATRSDGNTVSVRSENHLETFQTGLRSFVNEAKLLAQFEHPSLVKVFRFWEQHGTAYMAMPFYKGVTLKKCLRDMQGGPEEAWLRRILLSVLDALELLHNQSIFHRDIAPDNILLVEDDRPVLLDFGAARQVLGDLTHGLTVILKPGYAPLEQYAEVPAMKQGPWTDLYALGAVGYFAITGETPPPSVGRMMSDTMIPLRERAQGRYSDALLAALDQALQVKPEYRPQNTAAFRALLLADAVMPAQARAVEPKSKPSEATKSFKWQWAALGAVVIGAVALAAYYLQPNNAPAPVEQAAIPAAPPPAEPVAELSGPAALPVSMPPPVAEKTPEPSSVVVAPPRDNAEILRLLGLAESSLKKGEYPAAQRYAERVLKLEADNGRALELRQLARNAQKKTFDAIHIE